MLGKLAILFTIALACTVLAAQAWAATTRTVSLRDNFITLSSSTAPHGSVTFSVTNRGQERHTFNIKRLARLVGGWLPSELCGLCSLWCRSQYVSASARCSLDW